MTSAIKLPDDPAKVIGGRIAKTLIIVGILTFIVLLIAVLNGWTERFDHAAVLALRHDDNPSLPLGPPWLAHLVIDVTDLGSSFTLGLLAAFVAAFLFMTRKTSGALFLLISAVGGWCLFNVLKLVVGRPRPDSGLHLVQASDFSFPSGHATDSTATYLALALLFVSAQASSRVRRYGIGVAAVMIALIGASRVYLGVHYPTDVLAGWCCGLVWALVCWMAKSRLSGSGREADAE